MFLYLNILSNRIGGVVDSMLASSAVGRELKPGHKSIDWLAQN
jgi:hypothetical protein